MFFVSAFRSFEPFNFEKCDEIFSSSGGEKYNMIIIKIFLNLIFAIKIVVCST